MNANTQTPNTPDNSGKRQSRKTYGDWDWQHSTYYWKIYLNKNHPSNNPNIQFLTGYSKKIGQNEAQDKENLLRRKIFSLCRNGYFQKMLRIEFYQKVGEMLNNKTAPLILTVYPDYYNIAEQNHDIVFKKHGVWLQEFYYRLQTRQDITDMMPNSKDRNSNVKQDDYLNIHKYDFKNVGALYQHAAKLLNYGHAEGAVTHFIREYKSLKQWP